MFKNVKFIVSGSGTCVCVGCALSISLKYLWLFMGIAVVAVCHTHSTMFYLNSNLFEKLINPTNYLLKVCSIFFLLQFTENFFSIYDALKRKIFDNTNEWMQKAFD